MQSPAEATGGAGGVVTSGLLNLFDRNGDGQLDPAERQAGAAEMLRRFDRNHNGQLDPDEQTAAMVDLGARRPSPKRTERISLERRLFQQFDEDHDGELDESEQKVALKQLNRASSDRTLNRLRTEALRRLDTDGNGRIDWDELGALVDPPEEKSADSKQDPADSRPVEASANDRGN